MKRSIGDIPIVFTGAGDLATNPAKVFYRKGFCIIQAYGHTGKLARKLAQKVETEHMTSPKEVNLYAKLYIVSLKDSVFIELLPAIVASKRKEILIVHTAGSIPMSIWEGHASHYEVFYPMQTFGKQREVDSREIPFFIGTSSTEDAVFLKAIASILSDRVYGVDPEQRESLHLAAVFTCSFTNHMHVLAAKSLKKYNLPLDVVLPLIDEAAREVRELESKAAQTRPAIRYDRNVTGSHLQILTDDPRM